MATNASSFSPMASQPQYAQQLQQQPQPQAGENNAPLPAYLQQNQNAATANPTQNDLPGIPAMPGMNPESKLGNDQTPQQISLPPQANADSFTLNKKDPTTSPAPAFGKKKDKEKDDTKFGEEDDKKKAELAAKPKSPFSPSFGEDEKKEKE